MSSRNLAVGLTVFTVLTATPDARAQFNTWIGPLTGTPSWSTSAWSLGVPPAGGGVGQQIRFVNAYANSWSPTNDLGTFTLTNLSLSSDFFVAGSDTPSLVLGSTNPLRFDGAGAAVTLESSGNVGTANNAAAIILAAPTTFGGAGSGRFTSGGGLSGTGDLLVDRPNAAFLGGVAIAGPSPNYSGNVVLHAGRLVVGAGNSLGTGVLEIDGVGSGEFGGSELRPGNTTSPVLANQVVINAGRTLNVVTAGRDSSSNLLSFTFGSAITGAGDVNLGSYLGTSPATVFQGANTYAGATRVLGGSLTLSGATGSLSQSASVTAVMSTLVLDNTITANGDRIAAVVPVTAVSGGIELHTGSESVAALTVGGHSTLTAAAGAAPAADAALSLGNLARADRGTLLVRGPALGSDPAGGSAGVGTVTVTQINGAAAAAALVGGNAPGTPRTPVLPFAIASATSNGTGDDLVTLGANGLRSLSTAEYAGLSAAPYLNAAANNVRLNAGGVSQYGPQSANTLVLASAGNGAYGRGGPNGSLALGAGTVLATQTGAIAVGSLNFGAAEGVVFATTASATDGLAIHAAVTGTNGLTIAGPGLVSLTNPANALGGPVTVNNATLAIASQSALGGATSVRLAGGGALAFTGATGTLTTPLVLSDGVGAIEVRGPSATNSNAPSLTLAGDVSGPGGLRLNPSGLGTNGIGTLTLTGTNTFTGPLMVSNGNLRVDSAARLGNGPYLGLFGGVFHATASFALDRPIVVGGGTVRTDAGVTLTLNGPVTDASASSPSGVFDKLGAGTVVLTQPATNAGLTAVGGGTLELRGSGTLESTNQLEVLAGGELRLNNAPSDSGNRLNAANLRLQGGTLRLVGNAGTDSSEVAGQLVLLANGGSTLSVEPGAGRAARMTFSFPNASPLFRSGSATLLVTSPQTLGAGATDATVRFFSNGDSPTDPPQTNNVLPGMFALDAGGAGLLTASTGSTVGDRFVRRLTAADTALGVTTTFAGSTAASNVLSSGEALTGPTAANAAVVSGVLSTGGNALTLTSGNLVLNAGASVTGTGPLTAAAGQSLSVFVPSGTASVSTPLGAGTNTVSKTGAGTLAVTGSFLAGTTRLNVQQGTLSAGPTALPAAATLNVQTGATFLSTGSITVGGVEGAGTFNLGGGNLTLNNPSATATFSGTLVTTGSVVLQGAGGLILGSGANVSQAITLNAGVCVFGDSFLAGPWPGISSGGAVTAADGTMVTLGTSITSFDRGINVNVGTSTGTVTLFMSAGASPRVTGTITIGASKTLQVTSQLVSNTRLEGPITGAGKLTLGTLSAVIVTNANTGYSGTTTLAGTDPVGVGNDLAFGTGPLVLGASGFTPLFYAADGDRTLANNVTLVNDVTYGGTATIDTRHSLTFTGTTGLGLPTRTVTVTAAGALTLNAVSGGASAGLTKAGPGTLFLTGSSNVRGPVAVTDGTLWLNGPNAGTNLLTVGNAAGGDAAVLGGTGAHAGAVTVASTGTLAPGTTTPGVLTAQGLTLQAGATFEFDLAADTTSGAGTSWSQFHSTGGVLTIDALAQLLPVFTGTATLPNLTDPFWQVSETWPGVIFGGTVTNSSPFVDNSAWASAGSFATLSTGNAVNLVWTPVPEPAHLWAVAAAAALAVARQRKRRRAIAKTRSSIESFGNAIRR